jgi:putative Mg2+ transporter-C (MgtC) family protein
MPPHLSWLDIGVRLALTFAAGLAIGVNREATGHAAGLRTTLLVCLAASVSMIQMNLLLSVNGKTPLSFAVMDVARLPLGILTGVGFIGGGAILRRGDLLIGVTTASTIWMATVVGLCLGGGQLGLGVAATALTVLVLWVMKAVEARLPRRGHAILSIEVKAGSKLDQLSEAELGKVELRLLDRHWDRTKAAMATRYEVRFGAAPQPLLDRLDRLAADPDVSHLDCTILKK